MNATLDRPMLVSPYVVSWLLAFVFTQAVEVPLYRYLLPCRVVAAAVPSLLTHPVIWFLIFPFLQLDYAVKTFIAEAFAILAEAAVCVVLLRRVPARAVASSSRVVTRALVVATCANMTSLVLGLTSRRLFGLP